MRALLFSTFVALALFGSFAPQAHAQGAFFNFDPIIPPECNCEGQPTPSGRQITTAPDWGCVLQTLQNGINFVMTLGFMIAILFIVYTGALFVLSAGNPSSREAAKTRIANVIIGMLVMLGAWLGVDFIMKALYNPDTQIGTVRFGPWNEILAGDGAAHCLKVADPPKALPPIFGTAPTSPTDVPAGGVVPVTGDIPQRICAAAQNYRGQSTAAGPANGVLACAWAVNNVLENAGVANIDGDSVQDMEKALKGGRGTQVAQSSAVCGDIVLVTGSKNHVGICFNAGCSQVISNSSSNASFSWISGPNFAPSYNDPNFRIYRVTN